MPGGTGGKGGGGGGAKAGVLHRCLDVLGFVATHSWEDEREGVEGLGTALLAEEFAGNDGDGGGVEAAAQIRANGAATAQAAADGFAEEVEEVVGVLFVRFVADLL